MAQVIIHERANGSVIAASDEMNIVRCEGNYYFDPETVDMTYLKVTERTYTCPYKGVCHWVDLDTPMVQAQNVGWVYANPKPGFEDIRGRFAFYGSRAPLETQLVPA